MTTTTTKLKHNENYFTNREFPFPLAASCPTTPLTPSSGWYYARFQHTIEDWLPLHKMVGKNLNIFCRNFLELSIFW